MIVVAGIVVSYAIVAAGREEPDAVIAIAADIIT